MATEPPDERSFDRLSVRSARIKRGDAAHLRRPLRTLTKPTTAKIAPIKNRKQFLLPWGGFAEPFGIVKSSRKVASSRACKSPMATVFDDQRSAKTPRRQILPLAKFPCLRAFSTLCQSAYFVNILRGPLLRGPLAMSGACYAASSAPSRSPSMMSSAVMPPSAVYHTVGLAR